jgi:drug/metabolite transporter (DMT)-like permease
LNALLIQSSGPLFVALWSLMLFGVRLSWMQAAGILVSLLGVLVIVLRGNLAALAAIQVNAGDISFAAALFVFGLYSALMPKRPKINPLSLIAFTTGAGAVMLVPLVGWEMSGGDLLKFDTLTVSTIVFVVLFPSTLSYLFFNRGIELIGPNRAAPFFHLVPVFGSAMAILLLGEKPEPFHLVGYALVLAGIFTASRRGSSRTPAPRP